MLRNVKSFETQHMHHQLTRRNAQNYSFEMLPENTITHQNAHSKTRSKVLHFPISQLQLREKRIMVRVLFDQVQDHNITYEGKNASAVLVVLYFKEPIQSPEKRGLCARQVTTLPHNKNPSSVLVNMHPNMATKESMYPTTPIATRGLVLFSFVWNSFFCVGGCGKSSKRIIVLLSQ